jgi:hypothetical protein
VGYGNVEQRQPKSRNARRLGIRATSRQNPYSIGAPPINPEDVELCQYGNYVVNTALSPWHLLARGFTEWSSLVRITGGCDPAGICLAMIVHAKVVQRGRKGTRWNGKALGLDYYFGRRPAADFEICTALEVRSPVLLTHL